MKVRVKHMQGDKEIDRNEITGIRTTKDLDSLQGPGINTAVILELKHKGFAKVTMTDHTTMEMKVLND